MGEASSRLELMVQGQFRFNLTVIQNDTVWVEPACCWQESLYSLISLGGIDDEN